MSFTTDDSTIRGKVKKGDELINFKEMKNDDIVSFPNDDQFPGKYLVKEKPYLSLDRPAGTFEARLLHIE